MEFIPADLIRRKKLGEAHSAAEIRELIDAYSSGRLPDYQMAAWAMAVWFKGMNDEEIAALTEAMRKSGSCFDFSSLGRPRIDKHSTGGIGDKTSLLIGPIMAAAGVHNPMIAGRGLGHTGGTLDKLESIPGFRIWLERAEFESHVKEFYFSIMGQTKDICPADRKFYALRDVTSTVDSLPLICGSIMSKKLCEDLTGLVLDVKFGSGAFMKTLDEARELAQLLIRTGKSSNVRVHALLTNMGQPLGRFAGNALEVTECVDIMEGKKLMDRGFDYYEPVRELSLQLCAHMFMLADKSKSVEDGYKLATEILDSKKALHAFHQLLKYQGPADLSGLPKAKCTVEFKAPKAGYLIAIDTEMVGWANVALGAGRRRSEDPIDPTAGMEFLCRLNDKMEQGQPMVRLYADSDEHFNTALEMLSAAYVLSDRPQKSSLPLIAEVLT